MSSEIDPGEVMGTVGVTTALKTDIRVLIEMKTTQSPMVVPTHLGLGFGVGKLGLSPHASVEHMCTGPANLHDLLMGPVLMVHLDKPYKLA